MRLSIVHTWDGQPLDHAEHVHWRLVLESEHLRVKVDAQRFGDPLPDHPPGSTPRLWEHEVVELFIQGSDGRYLELELGPGGHYLCLLLDGVRRVAASDLPVDYEVSDGRWPGRWSGTARVSRALLPPPPHRINCTAIRGTGAARRYLMWAPAPGSAPDFHRLDAFQPVVLPEATEEG